MAPRGGDGDDRTAMMAVLAHTLVNSISAVLGLVDTLIDRYQSLDDEARRDLLGRIRKRMAYDFDMLLSIVHVFADESDRVPDEPTS